MDYYIDIRLKTDPDFTVPMLMGALYNKLHRVLVQLKSQQIGVSFPAYSLSPRTTGEHLRLHGKKDALNALQQQNWLTGMRDHVTVSDVAPVPSDAVHRLVRRVQPKTNIERLQRRCMQRHDVSAEEAEQRYTQARLKKVNLPYVNLRSQSTGEHFALFIEHGPKDQSPSTGKFSSYGLSSSGATVPWF